VPYK
jgi:hypothetical protein